jgi:hypothetical protein
MRLAAFAFFCVGGRLERLLGGGNVMRCVAFVFLFFLSCAVGWLG